MERGDNSCRVGKPDQQRFPQRQVMLACARGLHPEEHAPSSSGVRLQNLNHPILTMSETVYKSPLRGFLPNT